ncbi:hypothetical protein DW762_02275 [Ruminococcus sp. AM29-19LB]|jgi:hypothetical protein|nr:hypothetical protein DWX54_01995 [Ruminococcus sp. AF19-4LB]RGH72272.1 hypothetical protein DW772_00635 [Ruminococcus sp. AM29-5AC]RGH76101.1 hypothetical protein DW764_00615 [Ruminococcus sp. AM29-1LB]RGH80170.1 hypothetical protein DW762_02275 [Ruminococcus sp. AM29-19LB]RGH84035.1 hypothetical protein DW755_00905 [Ruminococcus sp. AM29-10LB]RGH84350.1 hypothetical protein DW752_00635 [Ruminococcus sp. AM29-1]
MELIYTDSTGKELDFVLNANIDMEIGEDEKDSINDFEVEYKRSDWTGLVEFGSQMYVPDTEYGGIVQELYTSTKSNSITVKGYTWRGMMTKKVIQPESNQDYAVESGELNQIIQRRVQEAFPGLFYGVAEDTGVQVKNYQFDRYCTLHAGLQKLLKSVGYRMEIKYIQSEKTESGYVQVRAVPIVDYSSEYEFSNDNNMHFTMDNNKRGTNHLICLGKGELKDRLVIHLYIDDQGNISQTQYFFGINEIAEIYDSSGSEYEDLLKNGTEKLLKSKSKTEYDMTMEKIEGTMDIGDIVGGRDYLTGASMKKPIGRKIWTVSEGKEKVEYKLEGET